MCIRIIMMILLFFSGCGREEDSLTEVSVSGEAQENREKAGEASEKDGESVSGEKETDADKPEKETKEETIVVYVCGAVKREGIVKLPAGSRIYEAVEQAGGMTEKAASSWLNQAEVLTDGARVYVPDEEEVKDAEAGNKAGTADNAGSIKKPGGTGSSGISGKGAGNDGKVNINEASKEELMTLTGIGEAKADSILEYRAEHGRFGSIEEIKEISGIKDGVFQKIKDKITV